MRIGLITYHYPHLKTEQVFQRLSMQAHEYRMFGLPFNPRKPRAPLFRHRPDQSIAISPPELAAKHGIDYTECSSDSDIDDSCELYLILGAGILSPSCVAGKRIINCHPGVIPASRGLDSFKWAILEQKPLGISLHYIDESVDAGELIAIVPTNVYNSDSLETLARRHYENEIDCLSRFSELLVTRQNPFQNLTPGDARMRMPLEREAELGPALARYTAKFGMHAPYDL